MKENKMNLKNLISDKDFQTLHEMKHLLPIIRNKGASFVREVNKLNELFEKIGKPDATENNR